jgi:hypothetical protein
MIYLTNYKKTYKLINQAVITVTCSVIVTAFILKNYEILDLLKIKKRAR